MSNAPSGWMAPPYVVRSLVTDYCYVDANNPGANFHQNFMLYREYKVLGITKLEMHTFMKVAISDTHEPRALLVPGESPAFNPLTIYVVAWQNGGSPWISNFTATIKAGIVSDPFDCSTLTWNSAAALDINSWLKSNISFTGGTMNVDLYQWRPAFDGLDVVGLPVAGATGVRLSVELDVLAGLPDNIMVGTDPLSYPVPNPITQSWAVVQQIGV